MISLQASIANATRSISRFSKAYFKLRRSARRWKMEAPTGLTKKEKRRNQTMLKGRRCRVRSGQWPGRGPGRTAHGRRG